MARARKIKPEFWTSVQTGECSMSARLLFIGCWNFCDDAGIHQWSPLRLKAEVFPFDPVSAEDIEGWLNELLKASLIHKYAVDGRDYFVVTGWHHQTISYPAYSHPVPNEPSLNFQRALVERSTSADRTLSIKRRGEERSNNPLTPSGGKRGRFVPPTVEQVAEYVTAKNYPVDAADFVDHYETCGWVQGKGRKPVKDWKACVRTWVARRKKDAEEKLQTAKAGRPQDVDLRF